jgi:signal transduction histidine kinase
VEDNGCGFDADAAANGESTSSCAGDGLVNMRRRLEELNGRCVIKSERGRATHVAFELELPI